MLQQVGQQAVTEKGFEDREHLSRKGMALLLAQPQALLGFLEEHSMAPRPRYFFTTSGAVRLRSVLKNTAQEDLGVIWPPGLASSGGS